MSPRLSTLTSLTKDDEMSIAVIPKIKVLVPVTVTRANIVEPRAKSFSV